LLRKNAAAGPVQCCKPTHGAVHVGHDAEIAVVPALAADVKLQLCGGLARRDCHESMINMAGGDAGFYGGKVYPEAGGGVAHTRKQGVAL